MFVESVRPASPLQLSELSSWKLDDEVSHEEEATSLFREKLTEVVSRADAGKSSILGTHSPTRPYSDSVKILSLRCQIILRNEVEPAILERSSTKQEPENKSEQVNITQIKSEPYHPTGALADPNGATVKRSQPSKIKSKAAGAQPTPRTISEDNAFHDVDEHMFGVEEQAEGHENRYTFDIRLRLFGRRLKDVRPRPSSSLLLTAYSVMLLLEGSMMKASEKPLKNLVLKWLSQNGVGASEIAISLTVTTTNSESWQTC